MKVEIVTDSKCVETRVVIYTEKMDDEVNRLVKRLSEESPKMLVGFKDDTALLLDPSQIVRIFASSGKVFAATLDGEYVVRLRLYEIEEHLRGFGFVRISNSEIIQLGKVKSFDLSLAGTICVKFVNSTVSYVSRRYVADMKKVLGI